jgi:DNA mismatch repair protein MLH1
MEGPRIVKLEESVVNRIAAGEVVQRPSAAIKEMLENSLDAGATSIAITVKGGGLQLLQIQDNGCGIRKEDLGIVCERFTTSKLRTFDDLKTISTFGFRGEALASITHVAHVTITTKTADSQCAYKAKYSDGILVPVKAGDKAEPKMCAGNTGTTIQVEDLFYNMQTRKQAFKNLNEQYQKILDVVTKYSIHYGDRKISFTCKKHGASVPDLHTPPGSSTMENLKIVYGAQLARELVDFSCESDGAGGGPKFSCGGKVSNANYSNKKSALILFINDRLVESAAIKRVVESVYADVLPRHTHPFVYLSVRMPPEHVDVNVHPTKKEVHFMHEDELLAALHAGLQARLRSANDRRTFYTQATLTLGDRCLGGTGRTGGGQPHHPGRSGLAR